MSKSTKFSNPQNPFQGEVMDGKQLADFLSNGLKKGIDETNIRGQSVGNERLLIEPFAKPTIKKKKK